MTTRHAAKRGHIRHDLLSLLERASAPADVAARGQVWVKNATPNELWFTDDTGTDFQLGGVTPTNISVTDESADTTCFPLFVTAATGDLPPKSGSNLLFNSSTGDLTATLIAGITAANLVDKTAAETISAQWTHSSDININDLMTIAFGDSGDVTFAWDGTDFEVRASIASDQVFNFRDGLNLKIYDSSNTDSVSLHHDGTDFAIAGTNTTDINITGITAIAAGTVDAAFDAITATSYGGITEANLADLSVAETWAAAQTFDDNIFILESASANADVAGDGQVWVFNRAPNDLWFTDDAGGDHPVAYGNWNNVSEDTSDVMDWQYINGVYFKDGTSAITLTVEASSVTTFPVGAVCAIINANATAAITVSEGTGTTIYFLTGSAVTDGAGDVTVAGGGYATIYRHSTTVYYMMGAGLT